MQHKKVKKGGKKQVSSNKSLHKVLALFLVIIDLFIYKFLEYTAIPIISEIIRFLKFLVIVWLIIFMLLFLAYLFLGGSHNQDVFGLMRDWLFFLPTIIITGSHKFDGV